MCLAESAATPALRLSTQATVLPVADVVADVHASLDVALEQGVVRRRHAAVVSDHDHLGLHHWLLDDDWLLLHHARLLLHLHRHLTLHLHGLLPLGHHHRLLLHRLLHRLLHVHGLLHWLLLNEPRLRRSDG